MDISTWLTIKLQQYYLDKCWKHCGLVKIVDLAKDQFEIKKLVNIVNSKDLPED